MNDKDFEKELQKRHLLLDVEAAYEWRKWMDEIPYIKWPSAWLVKAVPPFGCGIIRYWVTTEVLKSKHRVSIYLDCYSQLGCYDMEDTPYWEVYPVNDDVGRCGINDVEELLSLIKQSLEELAK